jgi:hypothetical protein
LHPAKTSQGNKRSLNRRDIGADLQRIAEANRILRLSDSQLAIVRQAAVPLSPSARDRYLKTVAAELAEGERVNDATVKAVVETVLCTLVDC